MPRIKKVLTAIQHAANGTVKDVGELRRHQPLIDAELKELLSDPKVILTETVRREQYPLLELTLFILLAEGRCRIILLSSFKQGSHSNDNCADTFVSLNRTCTNTWFLSPLGRQGSY